MNKLWEVMKSKGITQLRLSEITGIAQSEISKIMNDKKPKLTLTQAKRIAKGLNCTVEKIWPD
ncbi:helix-turn-helix domain-containing protein [Desulfosporosinus nitroreducens]|uniref:helix-turn-helix domain-containing protein n=1 Tax=Desulfosporosinus nitroreducens TaxID=2018668 RepID=UPI00207C5C5B|nr:helix-turn-helix transcriptional regulator [Desulfosporosinus nitroreducens]MCO1599793.1 helix-turn-helix transcriptional regulator [Desulfosporosinus nitroreducens]